MLAPGKDAAGLSAAGLSAAGDAPVLQGRPAWSLRASRKGEGAAAYSPQPQPALSKCRSSLGNLLIKK